MGDLKLDMACIVIGVIALIWTPYNALRILLHMLLLGAVIYQVGGWLAATGLMRRRS